MSRSERKKKQFATQKRHRDAELSKLSKQPRNSEEPFDQLLERLRKLIERYGTLPILGRAIPHAHEIENGKEPQSKLPWQLELLIRWAFEFGEVDHKGKRGLTVTQYNRLRLIIYDIMKEDPFLKEGGTKGLEQFLFRMLHQQLPPQRQFDIRPFARPIHWLSATTAGKNLAKEFARITGLTVEEFFGVAAVILRSIRKRQYFPIKLSDIRDLPQDKTKRFFDLTSLSFEEAQKFVRSHPQRIGLLFLQLQDASPLHRFPFLITPKGYMPYSRYAVQQMINTFVYDILNENGVLHTTSDFGAVFENYVLAGLNYMGVVYFVESDLVNAGFPKQVDAIVPLSASTLMIESKGTRLSRIARVNPEPQILSRALDDNIVDAMVQLSVVANRIRENTDGLAIGKREKFYGMIVTNGSYLLDPCSQLWQEAIEPKVKSRLASIGITSIPFTTEQLLIVDIAEFEELQAYVHDTGVGLEGILKEWEQNQSSSTITNRFLMLGQLLSKKTRPYPELSYLDVSWDKMPKAFGFLPKSE